MKILRSPSDVEHYLADYADRPLLKPLLIDQFLEGATELDVDAVSDGEQTVAVVMEQLEECGVHSGDSYEVYPPTSVAPELLHLVRDYTQEIGRLFRIRGCMNVQYAIKDGRVCVLEVNPRASRSLPFASKASGVPLADLATKVILGRKLDDLFVPPQQTDRVSVKSVVFPFNVFPELPPLLGPVMQSTGEAMGRGTSFGEAYWKAWLGAGAKDLPFGRSVYLSLAHLPAFSNQTIIRSFVDAGCDVRVNTPGHGLPGEVSAREPHNVYVRQLALLVALGRSPEELSLLQKAIAARVPVVTTAGGLRGLVAALREGRPQLDVEPLPGPLASESRLEASSVA